MSFCLIKSEAEKLKQAIIDGRIDPKKMAQMSSAETRSFLGSILSPENAREVNLLYEKKLLLVNQNRAVANLFRDLTGLSEKSKLEMADKIRLRLEKKNQRIFNPDVRDKVLEEVRSDALSRKYRSDISTEEASKIVELSKNVDASLAKIQEDSPMRSPERIQYGIDYVLRNDFVSGLIRDSRRLPGREYLKPKNYGRGIVKLGGITKSMLSSLDDSFFGTQGIKLMYTNTDLWAKQLAKSFQNFGKELIGRDAMMPIKADVFSRKNALNGAYNHGLDIGIQAEEAFPSALPEKIPGLGRFFKGAESAFNGAALRLRADLFDRIYDLAEKTGTDMTDKVQLEAISSLVNSMTGRGSLGKLSPLGETVNNLAFSAKFFKSNWDTLTAHLLDPKATSFTKKIAAKNLLKIVVGVAGIQTLANLLAPGSAERDIRSSNFGKIKHGEKTTDITGKMSSIITLASRLVPTLHDGEWGFWSKNSKGEYRNLVDGAYGQQNALDVFESFWEGKTAPLASLVRDLWKGKNYSGNKVTPGNALLGLITPLGVQSGIKNSKDKTEPLLPTLILDFVGFQTNTSEPKPKTSPKLKPRKPTTRKTTR